MTDVSGNAYTSRMSGFTKLFSTIVHSTVWREDMHVKVVWITMLALADRNGEVQASLPGLADASRVSIPQTEDALSRLMAPDPYSRTKEHEGRRVEAIDGGWLILNYLKYRELRSKDERRIQTREAVRRCRARKAGALTVSQGKPQKAQAEAEAYKVKDLLPQDSGLFSETGIPKAGGTTPQAKIIDAYVEAMKPAAVVPEKKHFINVAKLVQAGLTVEEGTRLAKSHAVSPLPSMVKDGQVGIDYLCLAIRKLQGLERADR